LGLPAMAEVRKWPRDGTKCDELAAAPYDPLRRAPGALRISGDAAARACSGAEGSTDRPGRLLYQRGRILVASGDFPGAGRNFEQALAAGYPVAAIDLARLLSQPSARMLNITRAISLCEKAWSEGVAIAAFELGSLHETGVRQGPGTDAYLLDPDQSLA